jgi:hypothetical protein
LLLTVAVSTLGLILSAFVLQVIKGPVDIFHILLFCILAGVCGWAVWIAATYRAAANIEASLPSDYFPEPGFPTAEEEHLVVCEFPGLTVKQCRVTADLKAKTIRFEHCHTARGFLGRSVPDYSCPMTEILDAHEHQIKTKGSQCTQLTIVTREGKALIPITATNYRQLRELVARISELTPHGPATDHPLAMYVYMAGALGGIGLGWMAMSDRGPNADAALIGYLMGGGFLGVVAAAFLLRMINLFAPLRVASPVVFALIGAAGGLFLAVTEAVFNGWSFLAVALRIGLGAVFGVTVLTYYFQSRSRSGADILDAPAKVDEA